MVEMNVAVNASSENLNRMHVLPTPESPISNSLNSRSYVFLAIADGGASRVVYGKFGREEHRATECETATASTQHCYYDVRAGETGEWRAARDDTTLATAAIAARSVQLRFGRTPIVDCGWLSRSRACACVWAACRCTSVVTRKKWSRGSRVSALTQQFG